MKKSKKVSEEIKEAKQKVIDGLHDLKIKMLLDYQVWAKMYHKSGAKEYMIKNDDEYWEIGEILNGELGINEIEHHIECIQNHMREVENDN